MKPLSRGAMRGPPDLRSTGLTLLRLSGWAAGRAAAELLEVPPGRPLTELAGRPGVVLRETVPVLRLTELPVLRETVPALRVALEVVLLPTCGDVLRVAVLPVLRETVPALRVAVLPVLRETELPVLRLTELPVLRDTELLGRDAEELPAELLLRDTEPLLRDTEPLLREELYDPEDLETEPAPELRDMEDPALELRDIDEPELWLAPDDLLALLDDELV